MVYDPRADKLSRVLKVTIMAIFRIGLSSGHLVDSTCVGVVKSPLSHRSRAPAGLA